MGIDFAGPISSTADDSSRQTLTLSDHCTNGLKQLLWLLRFLRYVFAVSFTTYKVLSDVVKFL